MKKYKKIVFNGKRIAGEKRIGVGRFTYEILKELDKLVEKNQYEVCIPANAIEIPDFHNIKIVKIGRSSMLWDQVFYFLYLMKERAIGVNLCGTPAIFKPGITCIHDVTDIIDPMTYESGDLKRKIMRYWHKIIYLSVRCLGKELITVSEVSKRNIVERLKIKIDKITVIGNAWQHFELIKEDDGIFEKYPDIRGKEYYFALGAQNRNKNFQWIVNYAKKHEDELFLVAGKTLITERKTEMYSKSENIVFLGYISDSEVKSLMKNCKAFIFPSLHEGFGIPPMEALSVGSPIVISDIECLREIYGDSAHYINPFDYNVSLKKILEMNVSDKDDVLKRFSWKKSANQLYELTQKYI